VITFDHVDLDDPLALGVARAMLNWGQQEGAIPADRHDIEASEAAIFAFAKTPLGDRTAIGCAVFYQPDGHDLLFLDVLFVSQAFRRQGIARELIERICLVAAEMGLPKIQFGTFFSNAAMRAVGARCGFTDEAVYMSRRPSVVGARQ
jgi:RimJ/RimL family protein N-acetyltransferase